jgi:hypothetical protein
VGQGKSLAIHPLTFDEGLRSIVDGGESKPHAVALGLFGGEMMYHPRPRGGQLGDEPVARPRNGPRVGYQRGIGGV